MPTVAIDENSANATAVTNVSDSFTGTDFDRDGTAITYSITAGNTGGAFAIDVATGAITVANSVALDFETTPSFTLTVTASDGSLSDTAAITVNLNNLNDNAPNIADATVAIDENSASATAVINVSDSFTGTDFDRDGQAITYSITAGNTGGAFAIDAVTGAITVANSAALDFETTPSFALTVTASDGSLSDTAAITVNLNNLNDNAPNIVDATVAIDENSPNATAVLSVSDSFTGTDFDRDGEAITYSITAGNTGAAFAINATTGAITVANSAALDFETTPSFTLTVTASDGTLSDTAAITVNLINLNENAPSITSDGGAASAALNVAENSTAVTTVTATDADLPSQTLSYSIVGGADAGLFTIDPTNGTLRFIAAPNFEAPGDAGADNVYDVTVQASDGTLSDSQAIGVRVGNLNEAPTGLAPGLASVDENAPAGTLVGTVTASDPDASELFSFTLVNDGAGRFAIDPSSGGIVIAPAAVLDFETQPWIDLLVRVTDAGGQTFEQTLRVDLRDLPEAGPAPVPPPPPPAAPPGLPGAPAPAPIPPAPPPTAPAPTPAPTLPEPPPPLAPPPGASSNPALPAAPDAPGLGTAALTAPADIETRPRGGLGGSDTPERNRVRLRDADNGPVASIGFEAFVHDEGLPAGVSAWDEAAQGSIGAALRNALLMLRYAPIEADTGDTHTGNERRAPSTLSDMVQDPVRIASVTFTAGFIWWLTRSGGLLTTMLMGVPAWRHVDLLPVLARQDDAHDDAEDTEGNPAARRGQRGAPGSAFDDSAVADLFTPDASSRHPADVT